MSEKKTIQKSYLFTYAVFVFSLISGVYYDWAVFASLFVNGGFLLIYGVSRKQFRLYLNMKTIAGLIVLLASVISIFASESPGDAFLGTARILTVITFVLVVMQLDGDEREDIFKSVPIAGITMIIISAFMFIIPELKKIAFETDRLAGLFMYANTMALFLLVGIVVKVNQMAKAEEKSYRIKSLIMIAILLLGILWTGSRTTFVMTFILLIYYIITKKSIRKHLLIMLGALAAAALVAGLALGLTSSFGRIMTFTFSGSTFIGRILYLQDALPVVGTHPAGLGYLGYCRMQPAFQTGVYSVRHIHNEYFQAFLDYGWLGGVSFLSLCVFAVRDNLKSKSRQGLEIVICFLLHMIMDFDMQFLYMAFIFMLCMNWEEGKEIKIAAVPAKAGAAVLMALSAWLFVPFVIKDVNRELAGNLYPWSYELIENVALNSLDPAEVEAGAKKMIELNPNSYEGYNFLTDLSVRRQDVEGALENKWQCLKRGAFHEVFYKEMRYIINVAKNSEDERIRKLGDEYNEKMEGLIEETKAKTSDLGRKIRDQLSFGLE